MSSTRQTLKRCLIAVAMTIAGLLAMQGMAQAAPTAAPDIVSHPADPNSTETVSTFTYTVGAGETSTASPLRFYCRVYDQAVTPVENGLWSACGTSTDPQPLTKAYTLENGNWKFEVAARETTNINTQGPIASYTWTQSGVPGPTEPPIIVTVPDDPNITNKTSSFKVEPNPAETLTVDSFRCRVDSGTGGWSPWYSCGSPSAPYTLNLSLPNGAHRFQAVAVSGAIQGTGIANYSWNQALPAPTAPPVIQTQPTSPVTTAGANVVKSIIDPADTNLASGMQCRLDDAAWFSCSSGGNISNYPTNGDHTFSVKAIGPGGEGPVASATWTVDVPEVLNGAIDIDDVASVRLDGASANSQIGAPAPATPASLSAGDVNGDGRNDLAIADGTDSTMQILFSTNGLKSGTMSPVGPDKGFRITDPSGGNDTPGVTSIGDQNGDGRDDLLVGPNGNGNVGDAYVVYGVADASSFPACSSGAGRCLDPSTMDADQGYKISNDVPDLISMASTDFDGDGVKDLAFAANDGSNASMLILKGGERTGTVDLQAAVGTDAIKVLGPSATQFGFIIDGLDDVNGDGKNEIAILGGLFAGSGEYVVTGRSLEGVSDPIDLNTVEPEDGFYIALAPLGFATVRNIGDMNGDGRDDLGVGYINAASATAGELSVVYMPELPTSDPILAGIDMEEGGGYVFNPGGAPAALGLYALASMGDVYGNGLDAMMVGATATPANGLDQTGALYLLKGQEPGVESPIGLGPQFTSDLGVAIVSGKVRQSEFGNLPTVLGDIDGDGLTDYAVSAPSEANNGLTKSGSVYIISGKNLFARAATGSSTVVNDTKATVNGQVGTNGRATDYQFEYGTSDDYGSSTDSQSLAAGGSEPVSADLGGLTPDTEYHYRLVVTNELGFVQKGQDKTFKTAKTAPKQGCEADATLPGCSKYEYCKDPANAGKAECQAPKAKLSGLIVSVAQSKVKRGKKTTAKATIVNTGTAAAAGTKVCLSAPKKMVAGAKCVNVGSLGAGVSKTVKFKVKVKKKAKKGKKVALKFKASANGLGSKTGKASIKVG